MARVPKRNQKQRNTVAIVGDGQTERIYFSDVRDTDRPPNLTIFPDYPRKIGNYKGVLERAIALKDNYDRVYAIIDMDKVLQDSQQRSYTQDKDKALAVGVIVLENNPCFEMWLLLHFINTGKLFTNCNEVIGKLRHKGCIPNYDKSEKFLQSVRLYKTYKSLLDKQAIPNAKHLENNREGRDPQFPRAETFRFFEWYLDNCH